MSRRRIFHSLYPSDIGAWPLGDRATARWEECPECTARELAPKGEAIADLDSAGPRLPRIAYPAETRCTSAASAPHGSNRDNDEQLRGHALKGMPTCQNGPILTAGRLATGRKRNCRRRLRLPL